MKSTIRNKKFAFLQYTAIASVMLLFAIFTGPGRADAAGLLKPLGGDADDLAIKSHSVKVVINNGFAVTEVDQVFFNNGGADLEAVYSFPVPREASVSELSLWIGGREVVGEVLEKEKAREVYEDRKSKGKDTAVAEKDGYRSFDVSVSPVRANDETRVRLVYIQPLEIDLNVGRYVYPLEEGNVDEERIAFWSVDDRVQGLFSFDLELKSAFPVKDVRLPGFQDRATISRKAAPPDGEPGENGSAGEVYSVSLDFPEGGSLSRDIVLYYRLDDSVPARVELIPYRETGGGKGTFMVVVTPGGSIKRIADGTDWTFVLDKSGSMAGNKIAALADGVAQVIGKMSPNDRFRIVTFDDRARDFSGGYVQASPENVRQAIEAVKRIEAGGSTALFDGLEMAYEGLDADRTAGILVVTDGVANVGPSEYADLMNLHRKYDIRLFTFMIGNSANRPLLENLAKESGGFAMNISTGDDIVGRVLQAKAKVLHEALYDARLTFTGERVSDLTPAKIGNLYVGRQLVLFGQYSDAGEVRMELTGRIGGENKSWVCETRLPETDTDNPEIERLRAFSAIREATDQIEDTGETEKLREKVVELGTTYSLVTDYTSMAVLDEVEMEGLGIDRKNARRVEKERRARAERDAQPVKSYRADRKEDSSGMFGDSRSPGIGTGPVGPLFVGLAYLLRRRGGNFRF